MDLNLIIPAFIAGVLTFLAPCTLPLVPGYLGFTSGVPLEDLKYPERSRRARWKIFANGVFFILGFSIVFIILGSLIGVVGSILAPWRIWLSRIGGIFVILFGLLMMNALKIPFLAREFRVRVPAFFERGKPASSLILGSAFGLGWTPCVGPVLGAILTLAASSQSVGQATLLLAIFSLGLAVPFLLIAAGIGSASRYIARVSPWLNIVSFIGGAFLVFLGILLLTNMLGVWIAYFYRVFDFIDYDRLLEYL